VVEVDAQPGHLGVPSPAPDDPVHAVGVSVCEVPGVQRLDVASAREIDRAFGVPEHHVGATVDDLTHVGLVPVGDQLDVATGDGPSDCVRAVKHLVRVERCDARRRLGLRQMPSHYWPPNR
jgi:hypothetical protein